MFKRKIILSFVTQYQPSVPNLTHILTETLANDREPTFSKTELQRMSNYIIQMRTVSKGYTRKSLTMRKA